MITARFYCHVSGEYGDTPASIAVLLKAWSCSIKNNKNKKVRVLMKSSLQNSIRLAHCISCQKSYYLQQNLNDSLPKHLVTASHQGMLKCLISAFYFQPSWLKRFVCFALWNETTFFFLYWGKCMDIPLLVGTTEGGLLFGGSLGMLVASSLWWEIPLDN